MQTTSRLKLAALGAVFLSATIVACGGGGGGDQPPAPAPAPAPAPPAVEPGFVYINEVSAIRVCRVDGGGVLSNCVEAGSDSGMTLAPTRAMAVGGDHAYVAIGFPFSSGLIHCGIRADATLSGCVQVGPDAAIGDLNWATLRGSTLYVGGSDSPRVRRCVVKPDGTLEPCEDGGIPDSLADAVADLQVLGSTAYLLLKDVGPPRARIAMCGVAPDGALSGCVDASVPELADPSSLTAHGNHLYVANTDRNTVIRCVVANGTLDDCRDSGAQGLAKPYKVALRGSMAYITNDDMRGGLTRCNLASDGLLNSCAPVPEMGTYLNEIVFR